MIQRTTANPAVPSGATADAGDTAALAAIIGGNRDAFDELYRRYYPRLMDFLARVISQRELAEEVVNDTMYTVWTASHSFAGRSKVSTWIFGIAYKKALKRIHRDHRWAALPPEWPGHPGLSNRCRPVPFCWPVLAG